MQGHSVIQNESIYSFAFMEMSKLSNPDQMIEVIECGDDGDVND